MLVIIAALLFCAGAALKLINFGRYCWGKGNKRGAIGLWLYALVTVALPAALFMRG